MKCSLFEQSYQLETLQVITFYLLDLCLVLNGTFII